MRSCGVAACRTRAGVSVAVLIRTVLSRSALKRARNAARGMLASACSSRSMRGDSGMGALHSLPQRLQRAELELLDRAFALAEPRGHFADAALLDVALDDHRPLIGGQTIDELEYARQLIDVLDLGFSDLLGQEIRSDRLPRRPLPAIDDHVERDPDQPRAERRAAPFVLRQRGKRLVKHVGRDVFRRVAAAHAENGVGVYPIEMPLVELGEPRRVSLGGLDEQPLVRVRHHSRHIYNGSVSKTLRYRVWGRGFRVRGSRSRFSFSVLV